MKAIKCDKCGSDNAKSFTYKMSGCMDDIDLCMDCLQDFVLLHKVKLTEISNTAPPQSSKNILFG